MGLFAFLGYVGSIFWVVVLFFVLGMEDPPFWAIVGCGIMLMLSSDFEDYTKPGGG